MDSKELVAWLGDRLDRFEERIEARMDRTDEKLDEVRDHGAKVDTELAKQAQLIAQARRETAAVIQEVAPIKDHVQNIRGIVWFLGIVGGGIGLAATIKGLLS